MKLQMVDVYTQYLQIKEEVDRGIQQVLETTAFINGPQVKKFTKELESYLGVKHVIPCANGTDALQIAMMAIGLKPGDEVIVPAFTYVATAEVIALLGLIPVMVDVDIHTFNLDPEAVKAAITPKTKAIVPVHLYGQSADMEPIMKLADQRGIYVIEDNAQALGAQYSFSDGRKARTGTIGHIGCTSFYPSKNLGGYGDGGAIMTNDDELADTLYKIANHGQSERYYHDIVGCNSRLDSIQAVVLSAKLKHLDQYNNARLRAADAYDQQLSQLPEIILPSRAMYSTHVFHQYTLRVSGGKRDALKAHLDVEGIPNMIYYPLPLYHQKAFQAFVPQNMKLAVTEQLCAEVISLPIHSEMNDDQITYISDKIKSFFSTK
jgi:UDP-2-acetamido-2-deoxy-ribo-hexuluronate aminotransferase